MRERERESGRKKKEKERKKRFEKKSTKKTQKKEKEEKTLSKKTLSSDSDSRPHVHEELVEGRVVPVVERAGAGSGGDVDGRRRGRGRGLLLVAAKEASASSSVAARGGNATTSAAANSAQNRGVADAGGELLAQGSSLAPQQRQGEPDARAVVEAVAAEGERRRRRRRSVRGRGRRTRRARFRRRRRRLLFVSPFRLVSAVRESLAQCCGEAGIARSWCPRGRRGERGRERRGGEFCRGGLEEEEEFFLKFLFYELEKKINAAVFGLATSLFLCSPRNSFSHLSRARTAGAG